MTIIVEEMNNTPEEETKQTCIDQKDNTSSTKALVKPRKYEIYDKKVCLNKRTSNIITFGYLRNEQYALEIDLPQDLIEQMFKFYYIDHIAQLLRPLPPIQDGQTQSIEIFQQKLALCETTLDFTVENMEITYENAKQTKTDMLKEITNFIASSTCLSDANIPKLLRMISRNLFRVLPYHTSPYINALSFINDDEKDLSESIEGASWPHLKLIYDILWRVINTLNSETMQQYLDKTFFTNLVQLFDSQQSEERVYAMRILHNIYGRSMHLRPVIFEVIKNYLYRKVVDNSDNNYNGISELLQIIQVVINGLGTPVKQKWKQFLMTVLIPLYKSDALKMFWEPLIQSCLTYISKDINAANAILNGLLQYWPTHSPQKEEIFIFATNNILNALIAHSGFQYKNHKNVFAKIFNKLSQCILSQIQTISQRVIDLLQERPILRIIDADRGSLLSVIVTAFHSQTETNQPLFDKQYWANQKEVKSMYKSLDGKYWKKMQKYLSKQHRKEERSKNNICELEKEGKEPWIVIKQKRSEKYKYKPEKAPKLSVSEKLIRRKYRWKQIQKMARANEHRFRPFSS